MALPSPFSAHIIPPHPRRLGQPVVLARNSMRTVENGKIRVDSFTCVFYPFLASELGDEGETRESGIEQPQSKFEFRPEYEQTRLALPSPSEPRCYIVQAAPARAADVVLGYVVVSPQPSAAMPMPGAEKSAATAVSPTPSDSPCSPVPAKPDSPTESARNPTSDSQITAVDSSVRANLAPLQRSRRRRTALQSLIRHFGLPTARAAAAITNSNSPFATIADTVTAPTSAISCRARGPP